MILILFRLIILQVSPEKECLDQKDEKPKRLD